MTGRFTLIVFMLSCDCKCFVAPPQCVVGWHEVYDCGISLICVLCYILFDL